MKNILNKKGFTLVELLATIAIIGIAVAFIVPNVVKLNSQKDEKLYNLKRDTILSQAELYAMDNFETLFQSTTSVNVYVYQLLNEGYLSLDVKNGVSDCNNSSGSGCVMDPRTNTSMNHLIVNLTHSNNKVIASWQ